MKPKNSKLVSLIKKETITPQVSQRMKKKREIYMEKITLIDKILGKPVKA